MLELVVRLVASLAVVIGLLLLCAKVAQRRMGGRKGDVVQVVQRQALSRGSAVTVVTVGSRVLVLGTTEQQVSVLAELDPEELLTAGPGDLDGLDGSDVGPDPVDEPSVLTGSTAHLRLLGEAAPATASAPYVGKRRAVVVEPPTTPVPRAGSHRAAPARPARAARPAPAGGALAGSVLSPATWRQAVAAVTRRAS